MYEAMTRGIYAVENSVNLAATGELDIVRTLMDMTKEVYETKDDLEALRMIDTHKWFIVSGCLQDGKVNWCLVRYR